MWEWQMKLRFIYKYKGSKVEHDKFLHCKNQMSNQNLHAIKRIQKRTFKTYRRYVKKITTRHFHATLSSILDILRKKVFVLISENMNIIFKEQIQEYQPIRQIYKSINVWEKCEFKLSLIYSKINRLQKCSDGISLFQISTFTNEEKHGI